MSWIRALILIGLFAGLVAAQRQVRKSEGTPLQPGTPIERSIAPGMIHHFSVTTDENNLVQINVEQRGIDVVITIYSPSGKKLSEHDSPTGTDGPENVSFVVVEKGPYRVAVSPLNQPSEEVREGRYEIKIIEVRQATEQEIKGANNQEILKTQALALLSEIEGVIPELRVPQTRIRTQLRAAHMLWDADEKRALKYMTDAITGLKELQANIDPDSREYIKSYHSITTLRYEIFQALIHRQPEMALTFLRSVPPLDDPYTHNMRMQRGSYEASLEAQIANQIASKDPKRALEIARETLKSRYSSSLIGTVNTLRQQNPEMAAELANDIATKLLSEKNKSSEIGGLLIGLLQIAGSPKQHQSAGTNGAALRIPLISEQQYRDLIQKALNEAIAFKPPTTNVYSPERDYAWGLLNGLQSMKPEVESVMNGGAALIEKKANDYLAVQNPHLLDLNKYQTAINDPNASVDDTMESLASAPKELQSQLYMQLAGRVAMTGDIAKAKQIVKDHITNAYERQQAFANIEQQGLYRALQKGKTEDALRSIANMSGNQERANMLAQIASQIGPGLKRAAALNLLEQARALLPPSLHAQDQAQMNALCEIARAFSRYDSKRAFEILEPLVDQFNEISAAARVLEGFGAEYYVQDELDLQNGNAVGSFAVQMTATIAMLGLNNFDRAKLTSDRIRLPEVRLRAYLDLAHLALQPPR